MYTLVMMYNVYPPDLSWDDYVELYLEGNVLFGSWFQHVKQGWNHARSNPEHVLFLR